MPNWCYNFLSINGSESSIKQIKDILEVEIAKEGAGKMFVPLVGMDDDMTPEAYENGGWYNHNINRFGCKWDVCPWEFQPDMDDTQIIMSFDTAWSPAAGFAELLTQKYGVETRLEFNESGNYFAGYQITGPDMTPEYKSWDYMEGLYHTDKEEFWHRFGTNVWDSFDDADEDNPPKTLEEILAEPEYSFFDDIDKEHARRHYEIQKADVLRYLQENGTLEERIAKIKEQQKES
jgi:hypothetical protein